MSDTQQLAPDDADRPPPTPHVNGEDTTEARARQMGWKPKEQFKGDPEKWVPADEFMDRGQASPAVMAERLDTMTRRMAQMERNGTQLTTKFQEAVSTIDTMTTMLRTSEKRAYERAKAELLAERERAVEAGDTATFRAKDTQLQELEKTAPVVMPQAPATPQPQRQAPGAVDPAVHEFYRRNPWYNQDRFLTTEADTIHVGLLNTQSHLSLEENLAETERRLRTFYPERFGQPARTQAPTNGSGENPRREEASAVSASSNAQASRRTPQRGTFAAMPQESKAAFQKYKTQLAGKGEPLTEQEWAEAYWSQFEEV